MSVQFGTKAETLERLSPLLKNASVAPLFYFTSAEWRANRQCVIADLRKRAWHAEPLIVRSSAVNEDQAESSLAGHFLTVADIDFENNFEEAVDTVIGSFGEDCGDDQVLVQPMVTDICMSGVVFGRDPNTTGPYIIVNYADGDDSAAVTSGRSADLKTFVHWIDAPLPSDGKLASVVVLLKELIDLYGSDTLDAEFAFDGSGKLYLLQVRPLVMREAPTLSIEKHREVLEGIATRVATGTKPDPFIHGRRTVYGVMPDWNPAEIIGIRPRPLALSLYRELVTDSIWAYQRNNYGYKNLRSHPLLVHFNGLPYIDARVSFNSFIPADIEHGLADRLVNYYIDQLLQKPHLHDKIEFEIIFSCYTPTLPDSISTLKNHGFRNEDIETILGSLRRLTNNIIHNKRGLWRADLEKIDILQQRHSKLMGSDVDTVSRVYWLLEDCKRYGSLPFAGLARAGFIAVQLLKSLVDIGVLTEIEYDSFMRGLNSVSSQMTRDRVTMDKATFLNRYGHLRPGTYDIMSPRYDEAPDMYFDWNQPYNPAGHDGSPFALTLSQIKSISELLDEHGLENDIVNFLEFVKAGIEGREYSKFIFTRNLSDAISLFRSFGEQKGFSPEQLSFADIGIIRELYLSSGDATELLEMSIAQGEKRYEVTRQLCLPPIISDPENVYSFHMPGTEPNFITQQAIVGPIVSHEKREKLDGSIVIIPNADPGYDWLFSFPIRGLITAFGGVNSHMAIRASELGLPAVIGAGESLYAKWKKANILSIDCANRLVTIIR
jgi:phosphohistidine swiveling domain-containing protein